MAEEQWMPRASNERLFKSNPGVNRIDDPRLDWLINADFRSRILPTTDIRGLSHSVSIE